jgi:uncharacterized membrane protein
MDPTLNEWLHLLFRWTHLLAGVMWIGHLWFFNFVNAQLAKTYDADSKKKVLPELMPRALYFFRWGAAYTWITGFLLLGVVYYMGGVMLPGEGAKMSNGAATGLSVLSLVIGWAVYDFLWKAVKDEKVGGAISFVLLLAYAFGMSRVVSGRAMFIHVGALFGTIMAANVWMRIWPNQRKIIAGVKGTGPAADPSVPALAGLRSKHNTYMSVPLLFAMVSNHFPTVYGNDFAWAILGAFVLVGFGLTKWLYNKSATPAASAF